MSRRGTAPRGWTRRLPVGPSKIVGKGRTNLIRKSFLRPPSATLTEDGRERARFKQADEAVWDILGLRPGSGRSTQQIACY